MAKKRSNRAPARATRGKQPAPRSFLQRNRTPLAAIIGLGVLAVILFVVANGRGSTPSTAGAAAGETGADFHSLVVDPAGGGRLFVGGHTKVSTSTDGGRTWAPVSSLEGADAMGWGFTSDAVFVSGHPGLNRSTDGGHTFTHSNDGLPGTDLHAFGAGRAVLYASAADAGLLASTDDGRTWELRTTEGTQAFFGRMIVDPAADDHVFAADAQSGVAESTDGGRTWTRLDSGLPSATWLTRAGPGLDVLIASGPAGASRSTDGGRTWSALAIPDGATLVEAVPDDPETLYAGIHDGSNAVHVQVSHDAGATWNAP